MQINESLAAEIGHVHSRFTVEGACADIFTTNSEPILDKIHIAIHIPKSANFLRIAWSHYSLIFFQNSVGSELRIACIMQNIILSNTDSNRNKNSWRKTMSRGSISLDW
ncbi:hypothetical protein PoB_000051800 [Plakobranchus ocellatus]|uniref:Uncharacterized protein n=1 Tax=Plakobranchus ocellatus TaxID=259542 RepID=A0AAV3XUF4_9GAST|nr:hypothetical protein PoB_000051800 [Plakobranchus ocellatus]